LINQPVSESIIIFGVQVQGFSLKEDQTVFEMNEYLSVGLVFGNVISGLDLVNL